MEVQLPKIKTVRIMLAGMAPQQEAVFKMAFKMHNTTHYEIVASSDKSIRPELVLVDVDNGEGLPLWEKLKDEYAGIPVAVCSEKAPPQHAPYLPKPIRFETLFPMLRSLLQGGNIYGESFEAAEKSDGNVADTPRKATIKRFNPNKGVLGALRFAKNSKQDIAILHKGKPILIVFPSIQRVLLTETAARIEELCGDDHAEVKCKIVPNNPQWRKKAKVTVMSCLWQVSIWTARGRLIYPLAPDTSFTLKSWPNLTRLAHIPESIRLSAFLTKTSVNLNVLYKVMPLGMKDILNYLAATYTTGFLSIDKETLSGNAYADVSKQVDVGVNTASDGQMAEEAQKITNPSQNQPRGLLQSLMKKLLGK